MSGASCFRGSNSRPWWLRSCATNQPSHSAKKFRFPWGRWRCGKKTEKIAAASLLRPPGAPGLFAKDFVNDFAELAVQNGFGRLAGRVKFLFQVQHKAL